MESMQFWLRDNWLKLLAIVMALGAFATFPYVYYQLLNWIVAGAALMTAYQAHRQKKEAVVWVFVALAVIFNPVAPLHLTTGLWQAMDVVAVILFAVSFYLMRAARSHSSMHA
jgi:hypothetical protein